MNVSTIARNIGLILLLNAFFMLLCLVVSICCGFDSSFSPLLLSAIITTVVGVFPLIFTRKSGNLSNKEVIVTGVLSWIVSCVFGMLPMILWGGEFTLENAFFESVSGYTTTGATILSDVEALPEGLLLWRSSTHFMGGLGVVLFMLFLLPSIGKNSRMKMSRMEISSISKENFNFRTNQLLKVIVTVYTTLAALETIALMIAGMDFLDALNHSFSTVATGGFGTRNSSIQAFDSVVIEIILMVFMFLSGLHFGLLYGMIASRSFRIFKNPVVRYYFFTIIVCSLLMSFSLVGSGTIENFWTALRHSMFQAISFASTTGFGSIDCTQWPIFAAVILVFLSIQCACSGSTAGGIKADRMYILFLSIKSNIKRKLHPNAVMPVHMGGKNIEPEIVSSVTQYISLYIVVIIAGTLLVSIFETDLVETSTSVISCLGNVGPGFGSIGPLDNYGHFAPMSKFILSLVMLLGRVEIYPFLVMFYIFRKNA